MMRSDASTDSSPTISGPSTAAVDGADSKTGFLHLDSSAHLHCQNAFKVVASYSIQNLFVELHFDSAHPHSMDYWQVVSDPKPSTGSHPSSVACYACCSSADFGKVVIALAYCSYSSILTESD